MALRRSRVRIPLGPFLFLKHIEKVDPYQGAAHGFESLWVHFLIHIEKVGPYRAGSTFIGAFLLFWIEKVDPLQGAAHGSNPPGSTSIFKTH